MSWRYDAHNAEIVDAKGSKVCGEVRNPDDGAHLAAAEDLYHAARRALNVLKSQGETPKPTNVLGALDRAIKKAEGKS